MHSYTHGGIQLTASPADTGIASVFDSYVSSPVRLTRTLEDFQYCRFIAFRLVVKNLLALLSFDFFQR